MFPRRNSRAFALFFLLFFFNNFLSHYVLKLPCLVFSWSFSFVLRGWWLCFMVFSNSFLVFHSPRCVLAWLVGCFFSHHQATRDKAWRRGKGASGANISFDGPDAETVRYIYSWYGWPRGTYLAGISRCIPQHRRSWKIETVVTVVQQGVYFVFRWCFEHQFSREARPFILSIMTHGPKLWFVVSVVAFLRLSRAGSSCPTRP